MPAHTIRKGMQPACGATLDPSVACLTAPAVRCRFDSHADRAFFGRPRIARGESVPPEWPRVSLRG